MVGLLTLLLIIIASMRHNPKSNMGYGDFYKNEKPAWLGMPPFLCGIAHGQWLMVAIGEMEESWLSGF